MRSLNRRTNVLRSTLLVVVGVVTVGALATVALTQRDTRSTSPTVAAAADTQSATTETLPPCPPRDSTPTSPPTHDFDVQAQIAIGTITVADGCGGVAGTVPYPLDFSKYPRGWIPVTGSDGTLVGYFPQNGSFIPRAVADAPGFDLNKYQEMQGMRVYTQPLPGDAVPGPSK